MMFETHACMNIIEICVERFGSIHIEQGQTNLNLRYQWQASFGHIASVHGHTIQIGDDGRLSHHISIPLYSVRITLKHGRWMKPI